MKDKPRLLFRPWFAELVAVIFAKRPAERIWEWADRTVFFDTTMAAEPGFYKSWKTPWTRRLQELAEHPFHNGHRIRKFVAKKSSQSGYTEAILNIIRWFAKFSPRNVIYAIDSREEVQNIRERLTVTLESLGENVLTDNEDDMGKFKLRLAYLIIWFLGSFSRGKFANKQAPFGVVDEAEVHDNGKQSVADMDSRNKTSEEGFTAVISKPELEEGVIDAEHKLGNQEIYLVPCPHCGTLQELCESSDEAARNGRTLARLKFDDCKDIFGEWDEEKLLTQARILCIATYCGQPIIHAAMSVADKAAVIAAAPTRFNHEKLTWEVTGPGARWLATHKGDPQTVSQHMSDLPSLFPGVQLGVIAKKIVSSVGLHGRAVRKNVWNHNLGLAWRETAVRIAKLEVLRCKAAYKRGEIPFIPVGIISGGDVGLAYAKWGVLAFDEFDNAALIDWGNELHPDDVADVIRSREFKCRVNGESYPISHGSICARFRIEDTYAACMRAPGRMWPVMGGGGRAARRSFAIGSIPTYPEWLQLISFNDFDFKSELYLERIGRKAPPTLSLAEAEEYRKNLPKLLLPENINANDEVVEELTHEPFKEDPESGIADFDRDGPNHYGDVIKTALVLWRYLNRNRTPGVPPAKEEPK